MTKSKFLFNTTTSSIQSFIMCHEHGSISLARYIAEIFMYYLNLVN
jgi:hypothetical protein